MRVLIVDDAIFARASIRKVLETSEYDFEYLEATSGEEAIELYKTNRPELVIMDITMPGMNGIEAVHQIHEFDEEAKIIMCSSMGAQDKIVRSIDMGAVDFIVKPYKPDKLLAVVKKVLGC
jgi:two-component system chemotaxis response regulator CheY